MKHLLLALFLSHILSQNLKENSIFSYSFLSKPKEKIKVGPESVDSVSTSSGALAVGVEQTDSSLSSFASQINSSLQILGMKIDSSISSTAYALESLILSDIQEKQDELSEINMQIHALLRKSNNLSTDCSGFRTCKACSYNPLCVWCLTEQICVGGDEDGPFNGECAYYDYNGCSGTGCRQYDTCETCLGDLKCGWCMNGGYCLEGNELDTGSCDISFFFHTNFPGKDTCPAMKKKKMPKYENLDIYINGNPSGSIDKETENIEREIIELRNRARVIVEEIEELNRAKAQVIQEMEEGKEIEMADIIIPFYNKGLWRKVETFSRKENESNEEEVNSNTEDLKKYIEKKQKEAIEDSERKILETQVINTPNILGVNNVGVNSVGVNNLLDKPGHRNEIRGEQVIYQ